MRLKTTTLSVMFSLFAFSGIAGAQTRNVTYSGPMKIGWEGAPGASDRWVTTVTHFNRTQSQKVINWKFLNSAGDNIGVRLTFTDDNIMDVFSGFDSISVNKSVTKFVFTCTGSANCATGLVNGSIRFDTTETLSNRYNRWEPDMSTLVVIQKLDSQGKVLLTSTVSVPGNDTSSVDNSFITFAQLWREVKTGIIVHNGGTQAASVTINLYNLWDFGHTGPYATTLVHVSPGETISRDLDVLFPGLPANDGSGGKVGDGNLGIESDRFIAASSYRLDGTLKTDLPVLIGRSTMPLARLSLVMEEGSAAAVDAQTMTRDPLPVINPNNFTADGRTRILFFVENLDLQEGEAVTAVSVTGQIGSNVFPFIVEDIRPLPNVPAQSQIMVKLPDGLPPGQSALTVTISLHNQISNSGIIRVVN